MKLYFTLTRARLAVLLFSVLIFVFVSGQFSSAAGSSENASTNSQRVDYISSLGITVDETCEETKEITIPSKFNDVYEDYNKLQLDAGFDLSAYMGCKVIRYTYKIADSEKRVDLLVFDGRVIGGDIVSYELDGQIEPLVVLK